MKAATRILFLDDQGEKFFGEGPAKLLRGVQEHGSLRAAALSMDMAYSKAMKLIRQAETALGCSLITRTTGGKNGGGSRLTPEGRSWLARYEAYRDACIQENQRLYRTFFPKTGCVIMASGMGVRFGANKLMADFLGAPLFLRAIAATEGLFDRRVVVTRHEEVARICSELGIQTILHDLPGRNDTVRLGLDALGDVDCCLFCPGDQPLLRSETVAGLLQEWANHPDMICRPACGSTQGSPVLFPRWTFPELKNLPQGKGGGAVISQYPQAVHTLQLPDARELMDVDTPEVLAHLNRHFSNSESEPPVKNLIIIRGGGDLATGTAYKLKRCGFPVLILETADPAAIRRTVAFSEAVFQGHQTVEGLTCYLADTPQQAVSLLAEGKLAILVDPAGASIPLLKPMAVVDAILAKKNLGTSRDMAPITIGLGPGFTAGIDVDAVIETKRGHTLGMVLRSGSAEKNTGIPGLIDGCGRERVIYSPAPGILRGKKAITDSVFKGETIAVIETDTGSVPVTASLDGIIRGMLRDGYPVCSGFKIADIDPRVQEQQNCFTISDKARCIAGGVLEALLQLQKERGL